MTIEEFLNKVENGSNLKEVLEIRTYIPIAEKKLILETVLDKCFTVENGVLICDYVLKKMAFELAMVKYHTNLDIDITSEDDYDDIQTLGINLNYNYSVDYKECQLLFEGMEKELRSQYSIESSVSDLLNKTSNSIEELTSNILEKINGLDMSSFGFEGKEFEQLKVLLNKYGK